MASCKKDNPVTKKPDTPAKLAANDSVSFVVDGKLYATSSLTTYFSQMYGNRGTNLKLSDKPGDLYLSSGQANKYWVGSADSVQYYSGNKIQTSDFGITFSFIKNYKKENMMQRGSFYLPNLNEKYYDVKSYPYAIDFGRQGKDEGVAIEWGNYKKGGSSFSPLSINQSSKLTADSQTGSSFKITKIEEVKGTDYIILEATFEANLFDEKEQPIKISQGFLRLRALKYGFRF